MNNEQILESWNLQFKNQKKLNFEEAKELLKLASKETDESLKKQYYDKVILGTEHVIYEYLKNSKLYLLSSTEINTEDIISATYGAWIECINEGLLLEKDGYSLITQSNKFNEKLKSKLGVKSTLKNSKIKSKIAEYFIKYYKAINNDKQEDTANIFKELNEETKNDKVLGQYDFYSLFQNIAQYLEENTNNKQLTATNIKKYIELILNNTIYASEDEYNLDSENIFENDIEKMILQNDFDELLKTLTPREQQTIYYIYFISKDDDENSVRKSRTELAKILNVTPERVKLIQEKAPRKLRHKPRSRKLNGYLEMPHKH